MELRAFTRHATIPAKGISGMHRKNAGFTLTELMIVVAIIGILAAIAIPAYQDYTIRAQVAEGFSLASSAKTGIAEFWQDNGTWPTNNTSAGLSSPASISGKYAQSVTISGNTITVAFGGDANVILASSGSLIMSGSGNDSTVQWSCSPSTIPDKWLPASCRR